MSVHRSSQGKSRRQGPAGHPGSFSQASSGGELRLGQPGQRPRDLSAGPVERPGRGAAQPAAGTRPASTGSYALSNVGSIRTGRAGTDQPAGGAAPIGGDRVPVDGGGDRDRVSGGNLARGPLGQLQRRRARSLYR